MAGGLTISTLNDSSGVLATQNGMRGVAKAWVTFAGSTGVIYGTSFNVSSVTRNGTGDYTLNFTTAMPNTNYCWTFGNYPADNGTTFSIPFLKSATTPSTTSIRISWHGVGSTTQVSDPLYAPVAIFSS